MTTLFPTEPSITLYDPLADLLGAGDGRMHYCFDDAVKLAGHACPTVAGAFLMACRALESLYGDETPTRGEIRVTMPGPADQGVNGPISQVFTLITGAAAENGFHGLGNQYCRKDLLAFADLPDGEFRFERVDTGASVTVHYDASTIPGDPGMGPLLQQILLGNDSTALREQFSEMWRGRVLAILWDGGESTIRVNH